MGSLGKISSIKKEYSKESEGTFAASLAKHGYSRTPKTIVRITPHKEKSGKYRTGLDPDALYIKQLEKFNPEEAAQEKARVTALREELEAATGLNLSPTSEYYTRMFDAKFNTPERAKMIKLKDGANLFNLNDPHDKIQYAWLRVHEDIAPSYQAWLEGKVKNANSIYFYVDDVEYETEMAYKEKTLINKAVSVLENMSIEKRFKVARLLGLPVRHDDKEIAIYNILDSYIKSPGKNGNKMEHVNLFNKVSDMSPENLNIRFAVEEALKYNIYRYSGMRIMEGENVIGKDKEDVIISLSLPKNQEDYLALEEKIRQRRLQEI